ncbi:MAG TPA: hypothetical protein VMF89_07440 [Polyangiales bacterium]|nr:hypothetical protein [Polyangiales bacterium]
MVALFVGVVLLFFLLLLAFFFALLAILLVAVRAAGAGRWARLERFFAGVGRRFGVGMSFSQSKTRAVANLPAARLSGAPAREKPETA